jgi:thiol-disulfide isomerase/thioredoxin
MQRKIVAGLVGLILASSAAGQDIKKLRLGEGLVGDRPDVATLKGHAVFVELWGVHCAPCLASMPHLVQWHNELGDFGLIMIGCHVQNVPENEIQRKVEAMGVRFPITKGGRYEGDEESGIPRSFLFDHNGDLIWRGHPKDAEEKIRAAVGEALVESAGATLPHRSIKPFVDDLKKGKPPLQLLQKLLPISKGSDEGGQQAKYLVDKMLENGQRRFDQAKAELKDDPVAAFDTTLRLSQSFKGTPLAQQATETMNKLRADKRVVAELRARPMLESLKKLDAALVASARDQDPKSAEFKKAFATPLKQMTTTLQKMNRDYPDAKATKEAQQIGEKYEIALK